MFLKTDLAEMEKSIEKATKKIIKTIYIVGLIQYITIVGSILAILNFMLK